MKWQQAYHRTKANKITIVTTSERDRKTYLTFSFSTITSNLLFLLSLIFDYWGLAYDCSTLIYFDKD
jgi:hypothetical protein